MHANITKMITFDLKYLGDDNDYHNIISILTSYHKRGFAAYFDEEIDKDYKKKMKFCDIVE